MQNSAGKFRVGIFVSALFCVFFSFGEAFGAAGDLDATFGAGGKVQTSVGTEDRGNAMVLQTDGKIVVGGRTRPGAVRFDFALARYNADGTLDTSFGNGGTVLTSLSQPNGSDDEILALALQPDGKIIAVGSQRSSSGALVATGVVRYNPNGSLDTTFGTGGILIIDRGVNNAVVLQPDGKIVVGGGGGDSQLANYQVTRLNPNGSRDTTFGTGGDVTIDFAGSGDGVWGLAIQPDGKIIAAGRSRVLGDDDNFAVARLNTDGSLDPNFGAGGKAVADFANDTDVGFAVVLQADGKIIVSGRAKPSTNIFDFGLVRFNADGSIDTNFGTAGRVTTNFFNGIDAAYAVKIQSNGKIVAAGVSGGSSTAFGVVRYDANGALDTTFGVGGIVETFYEGIDEGRALQIQPDGKIVVAGTARGGGIIGQFALARYLGDAPIASSNKPFDFEGDGKTDISIYRPSVGEWWYLKSSNGENAAVQFGNSSDTIVPADFTGDGKTDVAVWRSATGAWFVLRSENGSFYSFGFGTAGDIPAAADFDADGKVDAAVFRPSTATWYINKSTGGTLIQQFGASGDVPVVADYDGDGKSDIAIYRVSNGEWWIQRSTAGLIAFQFGNNSDKPIQGDYTGDGKADVAFFRPNTSEWFVLRSENQSYYSFSFGTGGDTPAPGDYDGDGKFDATVFRSSNNTWFVNKSTGGTLIQSFGVAGDKPVPNAFVP